LRRTVFSLGSLCRLGLVDDPRSDLGAARLVRRGDQLQREACAGTLAGEAEAEAVLPAGIGLIRLEPSEERAAGAVGGGDRERAGGAELLVERTRGDFVGVGRGRRSAPDGSADL